VEQAAADQEAGVAHLGDAGVDRRVPFAVAVHPQAACLEGVAVADDVHPGPRNWHRTARAARRPSWLVQTGRPGRAATAAAILPVS
jgi:hypothetical protein